MRIIWFTIGWIAVGLGALGTVLPLLPTVPFLLLAAMCFARSSDRVHHWLVTHSTFGPPIDNWRRSGAISRPMKRMALLSMGLSMAIPALLGAPIWVSGVQALALAGVAAFILTRPEGDVA